MNPFPIFIHEAQIRNIITVTRVEEEKIGVMLIILVNLVFLDSLQVMFKIAILCYLLRNSAYLSLLDGITYYIMVYVLLTFM